MKSCPTCNRTFEDSFTFCLIDGSVLSAPFDAQATKRIPVARITKAPRTEVLPPETEASPDNLVPTMRAPLLPPRHAHLPSGYVGPNNAPVAVGKTGSGEDSLGWIIGGMTIGVILGIILGLSMGDPKDAIPLGLLGTLLGALIGKLISRTIKKDSERVNQ
jgi:hypothetical protein